MRPFVEAAHQMFGLGGEVGVDQFGRFGDIAAFDLLHNVAGALMEFAVQARDDTVLHRLPVVLDLIGGMKPAAKVTTVVTHGFCRRDDGLTNSN